MRKSLVSIFIFTCFYLILFGNKATAGETEIAKGTSTGKATTATAETVKAEKQRGETVRYESPSPAIKWPAGVYVFYSSGGEPPKAIKANVVDYQTVLGNGCIYILIDYERHEDISFFLTLSENSPNSDSKAGTGNAYTFKNDDFEHDVTNNPRNSHIVQKDQAAMQVLNETEKNPKVKIGKFVRIPGSQMIRKSGNNYWFDLNVKDNKNKAETYSFYGQLKQLVTWIIADHERWFEFKGLILYQISGNAGLFNITKFTPNIGFEILKLGFSDNIDNYLALDGLLSTSQKNDSSYSFAMGLQCDILARFYLGEVYNFGDRCGETVFGLNADNILATLFPKSDLGK